MKNIVWLSINPTGDISHPYVHWVRIILMLVIRLQSSQFSDKPILSLTSNNIIMYNYEVNLSWTENRKGIVSSPVLEQSTEVATPPEFPKGIEGIWSPEHLFVAAIESCLMTTFLAVAENSKLEFVSFSSHATGKLDKVDGKFMMTEVLLRPTLVIKNPEHQEKAKRVLEMSEKACLISNSVKSTIVFEPVILVQ